MRAAVRRLFAYWLDFTMLALVLVGLQLLTYFLTNGYPFDSFVKGYQIERWVLLTMSLPVWLYFILCEFFAKATIGKRLLKLRVVSQNGTRINIFQAVIRTFIKLLPWEISHMIILLPDPWWGVEQPANQNLIFIPNILMLLYIIVLFLSRGRKGIHDYIVGTSVKAV